MEADEMVFQSYSASFDKTDGSINFPLYHGFGWIAYSDALYTAFAGMVDLFDVVGLEKDVEPENPNEGWTSLGMATFMDGWMLPALEIDQTKEANWYKVELQQNDANDKIYRLVNPYKGDSPIAKYNESTKDGYIQFDVTDPDHVVFAITDAGFANKKLQFSKLYCFNKLTFYMDYYSKSASEIIAGLGDKILYTTFKDGVVALPSVMSNGKWSSDACFGDQTDRVGGWYWADNSDNPVNMACKIIFPSDQSGIAGVVGEDSNAPVKYYNLQGVAVDNPVAGQLVIKRQGSKVTKIIVK